MPEYPSETVAFLFTDIEGSTKRWETDQQAMQAAVERHFALLRESIAAQDGVLFKTIGDAIQAAFPTVSKSIAAAIAAQVALGRDDWGNLGPLRVRMAIHAGEATPRDSDYLAPRLTGWLACSRPDTASRFCSRTQCVRLPQHSPWATHSKTWADTACETCSMPSAFFNFADQDCRLTSLR